jgi:type II secretory pathway pseudopilin PulG
LLVVIAILTALIAILIPALSSMRQQGFKAHTNATLGALRMGLAQYFNQFTMYPPSSGPANRGDQMLGQGLQGPSGTGFRMRPGGSAMGGGTLYGPYGPTDVKAYTGGGFIDGWGNPILYYRSTKAQSPTTASSVTAIFGTGAASDDAATYLFNSNDCKSVSSTSTPPTSASPFFPLIGASDNTITGPVSGAASYILISAGPDGKFFTATNVVATK